MLQRKFLLVLGTPVVLLMATAVTAILLLHGVLKDLDALGASAVQSTNLVLRLSGGVSQLNAELNRNGAGSPDGAILSRTVGEMRHHAVALRSLPVIQRQEVATSAAETLSQLVEEFDTAAGGSPAEPVGEVQAMLIRMLPGMRTQVTRLDEAVHSAFEQERAGVVSRFRLVALGLGVVFLIVINLSVIAVSRTMGMVLRPVNQLVEASRRLAREDFGHRVELGPGRNDEFAELAHAYNSLAQQLQTNESRKIETMHQVARTLSHEVNNAISIIECQLALLTRAAARSAAPTAARLGGLLPHQDAPPAAGDAEQAERLNQIRQSLGRISRTVEALTRVRRIVLTDYLAGVSMLDLERSIQDPSAPAPGGGSNIASGGRD